MILVMAKDGFKQMTREEVIAFLADPKNERWQAVGLKILRGVQPTIEEMEAAADGLEPADAVKTVMRLGLGPIIEGAEVATSSKRVAAVRRGGRAAKPNKGVGRGKGSISGEVIEEKIASIFQVCRKPAEKQARRTLGRLAREHDGSGSFMKSVNDRLRAKGKTALSPREAAIIYRQYT